MAQKQKKRKNKASSMVKHNHKDSLFRALFKIVENFLYLYAWCADGATTLTADDLEPLDLDSDMAKRIRRNDASFVTKDGRLIVLIEHQSTINPNMALRILLYYFELLQLWIKHKNINLYSTTKIQDLPTPEFYVVYNGKAPLQEVESHFNIACDSLEINVRVRIVDIHFEQLKDIHPNNTLAGYAYFYKEVAEGERMGLQEEKAFERARDLCIAKGYLTGYANKEDFVMYYKEIFDYDYQLRQEARNEGIAEGEARGEARGKARGKAEGKAEGTEKTIFAAIKKQLPRALVESLASDVDVSLERVEELYALATV